MNKNHRDQTLLSTEKNIINKENGLTIICIFLISATTQTSKQTIYSFNNIQAPGLNITQCYNICNTVIIMMIKR